jgi:DNA-3-methyladenine glycosylase I
MTDDRVIAGNDGLARCWWCGEDTLYRAYHDTEWGYPVTDDTRLFEKICLEGFQSGLSWLTILKKREAFRRAFAGFDYAKVARFDERDVEALLADASIVRHRGKIEATIGNARAAIAVAEEHGSLAHYFWRFEPPPSERPASVTFAALRELAETPSSKAMSKDLKKRGFRFVGPTTCYAFMQAMGLVNDHLEGCSVRAPVERARTARAR